MSMSFLQSKEGKKGRFSSFLHLFSRGGWMIDTLELVYCISFIIKEIDILPVLLLLTGRTS